VACYAIQTDKAWIRAGQQIDMPDLTKLADDMVLRGSNGAVGPPHQDRVFSRRIPAGEVPAVAEEICAAADVNRGAEFEILWRVVTR
jgi:hypothetical protein